MAGCWLIVATSAMAQATSDACDTSQSAHQNYRTQDTLLVVPNGTSSPTLFIGIEHKGIFKSTDGGATWARRDTGIKGYPRTGSESDRCIRELGRFVVDPNNSQHLYVLRVESPGRLDMVHTETAGIHETTDGGLTWTQLTGHNNASGGHGLAIVAGAPTPTVYMGTLNGQASWGGAPAGFYNTTGVVYRSTDGGQTWTELDQRAPGAATINDYLSASQIYVDSTGLRIWVPAIVRSLSGGMAPDTEQVGYLESADGGATWIRGAARLSDPLTDPSGRAGVNGDVAPANFNHRILTATNTPTSPLAYSWYTLDGTTWQKTPRYLYVARYSPHDPAGLTAFGYDPFAGAPGTSEQGVFKTIDGGATWSKVGELPPGVDNEAAGVRISHFAFHPTDPNTIYANGSGAYVWRSTDGGVTWTTLLHLNSAVVGGPNSTAPAAPGAPGTPVVSIAGRTLSVSWTAPTTGGLPASYIVETSDNAGFTTVTQTAATERSASVTVTGSGFWYVRVVAVGTGSVGNSVPSASTTVSVPTPATLTFAATKNGAAGALVAVTPAQVLSFSFAGGAPSWTASVNRTWVQLSSTAGTGAGRLLVTVVDPTNEIGASTSLSATVTITVASLSQTIAVPVQLTVSQSATAGAVPFGAVDSPTDGASGLSGAIAMTGWALDDVAVDRVEIWRNCLTPIDSNRPGVCRNATPTGAANQVFIGNAAFVPGARSDIESSSVSSGFPQPYRAGWGYLLLTNALPNQSTGATEGGQGAFTLSAYAVDAEGQYTLLGARTITIDNDNATAPFGAIDTPEQGGTITGALTANFGWAMTRRQNALGVDVPKCIERSRYRVFIDGVARTLTPGTNWFPDLSRADLTAAYPGLCDSANSLAAYYIDVTALGLANGLHTIGWDVYDDNGTPGNPADDNVAGIGSRFFNILIGGADASAVRSAGVRSAEGVRGAGVRGAGVRRELTLLQGRRAEVDLGGAVSRGYLVVGDQLRDLPIGSTLDAARGVFYWEPTVAHFGAFEMVFVSGTEGAEARTTLHVTIVDPTAGGDPAITITSPRAGANPNPIITVTGTARDPRAVTGTGIDAVHVWARRLDGPGVQFLGKAELSSDAYRLTSTPLAAGTYQIEVYAWVARTGTWAPAATVVIAVR